MLIKKIKHYFLNFHEHLMIKSLFSKLIIFLIYKKIIINKALFINFKNIL